MRAKKEVKELEHINEGLNSLLKPYDHRYAVCLFDSKYPPVEGDTITIGGLVAEFKKQ